MKKAWILFLYLCSQRPTPQFCLKVIVYQILFTSSKILPKWKVPTVSVIRWSFRSTFCRVQSISWSHRHKKCSTTTISISSKKSSIIFLHCPPQPPLSSQKKRSRFLFVPGQGFWEHLVSEQKECHVKG